MGISRSEELFLKDQNKVSQEKLRSKNLERGISKKGKKMHHRQHCVSFISRNYVLGDGGYSITHFNNTFSMQHR